MIDLAGGDVVVTGQLNAEIPRGTVLSAMPMTAVEWFVYLS